MAPRGPGTRSEENEYIQLPAGIVKGQDEEGDDLITRITELAFPKDELESYQPEIFTSRAILTPMNEDVDAINSILIDRFPGGMSPHELVLKPNSPVILLRNLLPSSGLCNGEHVFIPRINLRPPASAKYPFQFQRKQFPIKLSFAMTINKSQGQTLDQVAIYLPRPCFSPGQLYVALSRARRSDKVAVIAAPPPENAPPNSVKNIVS